MSKKDSYILKEDEIAQWQQAMQDVKPYTASTQKLQPSITAPKKRAITSPDMMSFMPSRAKHLSFSHLTAGKFAGVDAATVKKIKRGQMPIGTRIDLHGMTQEQAFMALQRSVMNALMQRKRLMLVITGKGSGGEGILKTSLPKWLNDDVLRPYLLAFDWARREDGGSGAAYVLLKKLVVEHDADGFSGR